jgi:hypothetical protein
MDTLPVAKVRIAFNLPPWCTPTAALMMAAVGHVGVGARVKKHARSVSWPLSCPVLWTPPGNHRFAIAVWPAPCRRARTQVSRSDTYTY